MFTTYWYFKTLLESLLSVIDRVIFDFTGWAICRFTLCCVSKTRNKGLILCTTKCYSCQVAYRSELSQTARISLLVCERNSCRASSFQCIYPCFNKSFING